MLILCSFLLIYLTTAIYIGSASQGDFHGNCFRPSTLSFRFSSHFSSLFCISSYIFYSALQSLRLRHRRISSKYLVFYSKMGLVWTKIKYFEIYFYSLRLKTQFVKVWWSYVICKNSRKTQSNRRIYQNQHICHFDVTKFMYTICESLVRIQYFKHECSSIMYENTQKM